MNSKYSFLSQMLCFTNRYVLGSIFLNKPVSSHLVPSWWPTAPSHSWWRQIRTSVICWWWSFSGKRTRISPASLAPISSWFAGWGLNQEKRKQSEFVCPSTVLYTCQRCFIISFICSGWYFTLKRVSLVCWLRVETLLCLWNLTRARSTGESRGTVCFTHIISFQSNISSSHSDVDFQAAQTQASWKFLQTGWQWNDWRYDRRQTDEWTDSAHDRSHHKAKHKFMRSW